MAEDENQDLYLPVGLSGRQNCAVGRILPKLKRQRRLIPLSWQSLIRMRLMLQSAMRNCCKSLICLILKRSMMRKG